MFLIELEENVLLSKNALMGIGNCDRLELIDKEDHSAKMGDCIFPGVCRNDLVSVQ